MTILGGYYNDFCRRYSQRHVRFASRERSECFVALRAVSCLRSKRFIDKTLNLCYTLFKGW